jgi:hypothetical protein
MARIEFQLSTKVFLATLQQLLESRLYAHCFVSPITGLLLDHIEVGVQGPVTRHSNGGSTKLNVALHASIFVVSSEDVVSAQGGPPSSSLAPNGVRVSANIVVSLDGMKLTAAYDGIVHDEQYDLLEALVGSYVGGLNTAKSIFSLWERTLKTTLGSTPLISKDFKDLLLPQVKSLPNGRSALCADSTVLAARFEVGRHGSDGSWSDFANGKPGHFIEENKWGLFISGDVLVEAINSLVQSVVSSAIPGVPFGVSGIFGLLAGSDPLPYFPLQPIPSKTPAVTSSATVDFNVEVTFLGIEVGSDHGSISLISTLLFTLNNQVTRSHGQRSLDISLYFSVDTTNDLGGIFGDLFELFGFNLNFDLHPPSGFDDFSATDVLNFYTSRTSLTPVVIEKILTLNFSECAGTVEPPVPQDVNTLLDALSSGNLDGVPLVPGTEFTLPGAGMLLSGPADLASGKSRPDCGVSSKPFVLLDQPVVVNASTNQVYLYPPTPPNVPAVGSFTVFNTGSHASNRYSLIIGGMIPYYDPAAEWFQLPSLLPQAPLKGKKITVTIPEAQFRPAYMASPYPLCLIVCTNGGARFVSLGEIPAPVIDPTTGEVTNATIVNITVPPLAGQPQTGPQHPVVSNKAPGRS